MLRIDIISASAGSGKTTRLSKVLEGAICDGSAAPEAVLATTFTNKAAAELQERVRTRLLQAGRIEEAQRLGAARIGTVNAVCGALVSEFAFELELSPSLGVLDEVRAKVALRRSLTEVLTPEVSDELSALGERMAEFDWAEAVNQIVDRARTNGLSADALAQSAERSVAGLLALFGEPVAEAEGAAADAALLAALERFCSEVDLDRDTTDKTKREFERAARARTRLRSGRPLPWSEWLGLAGLAPGKKSAELADGVLVTAALHDRHPRLHADLERAVRLCFELAARTLEAYAAHKRAWGVIDFVDQEVLALKLLRREDIRARLAGELDLVLVDEFQDTSPLQLAIFLELAGLAKRSVWVGDQKQSIFGFRGTDPTLMDAALVQLLGDGQPETLAQSWRSRPKLVEATSELFARCFPEQGIPRERVVLTPGVPTEPAGLGAPFEHWRLRTKNVAADIGAVAAGVRQVLAEGAQVRDRVTGRTRPLVPGDVAVLCSTNAECSSTANALEALGIRAVVPRTGLMDTPEARLVSAALRLFVDDEDALASAEVARLLHYADDAEGFLDAVLLKPGSEAFDHLGHRERMRALRESLPFAGALTAFDAVTDALDVRGACLAWGDSAQRLANLDALRVQAVSYVSSALQDGAAATAAGLVAHFDELAAGGVDEQATEGGPESVVVLTWHRAKGLEWPVVVLFGAPKGATALGVHVESDRERVDIEDALGGRWMRFWPTPYLRNQSKAPFHQRLGESAEQKRAEARARAQNLRLAYVGWTRARDRLVLAGRGESVSHGFGALLAGESGPLLSQPVDGSATWAGCCVEIRERDLEPQEAVEAAVEPGEGYVAKGAVTHPPAWAQPSGLEAAGTVGEPERLGERLALSGEPDMARVGEAVHGFLAADVPGLAATERLELARRLLDGWGVPAALQPAALLQASDRFRAWAEAKWPQAEWWREWPVQRELEGGTVLRGRADLMLASAEGVHVVDHKSFPGTTEQALARAATHAGQLMEYARAAAEAGGRPVGEVFIHLPLVGMVVPVRLAEPAP